MVIPSLFMSDFAWEQLNSIVACYPESQLLLCWWHVLHAWQQHFIVAHYPDMWALLNILYLENTWLKQWHMWSATERQNRTILELSDTNMLVELYVFHLIIDSQADKLVGQVASHAQRQIPAWKAE